MSDESPHAAEATACLMSASEALTLTELRDWERVMEAINDAIDKGKYSVRVRMLPSTMDKLAEMDYRISGKVADTWFVAWKETEVEEADDAN